MSKTAAERHSNLSKVVSRNHNWVMSIGMAQARSAGDAALQKQLTVATRNLQAELRSSIASASAADAALDKERS